jgi:hypothetical protein
LGLKIYHLATLLGSMPWSLASAILSWNGKDW